MCLSLFSCSLSGYIYIPCVFSQFSSLLNLILCPFPPPDSILPQPHSLCSLSPTRLHPSPTSFSVFPFTHQTPSLNPQHHFLCSFSPTRLHPSISNLILCVPFLPPDSIPQYPTSFSVFPFSHQTPSLPNLILLNLHRNKASAEPLGNFLEHANLQGRVSANVILHHTHVLVIVEY